MTIGERVMAFGRRQHPLGTAARMSDDTFRATRGRGIPAETIASWGKRGSDPKPAHLLTLRRTYGWAFICEIFLEVDDVEMAAAERAVIEANARLAALKQRSGR